MGSLFGYLLHLGIVRVSFVPIVMAVAIYVLYRLAAPPEGNDDEAQGHTA
jgi:hypothetical protein